MGFDGKVVDQMDLMCEMDLMPAPSVYGRACLGVELMANKLIRQVICD
jgi:hypothetical protein